MKKKEIKLTAIVLDKFEKGISGSGDGYSFFENDRNPIKSRCASNFLFIDEIINPKSLYLSDDKIILTKEGEILFIEEKHIFVIPKKTLDEIRILEKLQ